MDGKAIQDIVDVAREGISQINEDAYDRTYGVFAHPADIKLETIDLEQFQPTPRRKRGSYTFRDAIGFVAFVGKHVEPGTLVLADVNFVRAIINGHSRDAAGWGDLVAQLELQYTPSWTAWTRLVTSGWVTQEDFGYFLEQHAGDVAEPDGATLLEAALNLRVKKDAEYAKALVLQNGAIQLQYGETITATAQTRAGTFEIPERITLGLKPFEGGDLFKIPALLRYKLSQGVLSFRVELGDEARKVFEQAFDVMCEQLGVALQIPVLRGRAS